VPGEENDPVPVGEALAAVSAEFGLGDPATLARLTAAWPEIVGPAVAAHTRLRTLRDANLTIAVDAGPWATELRYLSDTLRERFDAVAGSGIVREIRVVVEPRA
jgi:predicted nucleic acid-binding Zn ribbon protein